MVTSSDPQRDKHMRSAYENTKAQMDMAKQLAGALTGGPGMGSAELIAALTQAIAANYAAEVMRYK